MLEGEMGYGYTAISYGGDANSSLIAHKNITILLLKPFKKAN
jgi:hypothetical protein